MAEINLRDLLRNGYALQQQGKFAEAERLYTQVLAAQPANVQALHLLGVLAFRNGQTERGVELIEKAVTIDADFALAHCNLASGLRTLNRPVEALRSYDKSIALWPSYSESHYGRALVLADLGRFEEALAAFERAIQLKPNFPEAYHNRGDVLIDLKRTADAVESYDRAIALKPDFAAAYSNRGLALKALDRPEDALASYDQSIALRPDIAKVHHNRGNTLRDLKRFAEALSSYDTSIVLRPDYAEAYNNRAFALTELRRLEEALESYDKAIMLKPDFIQANWNKSHLLLLLGEFEQGWRLHEYRKQLPEPVAAQIYSQPMWLGEEDIEGKILLVESEQGLGDVIQFSRYVHSAQARGAHVILSVQKKLVRLMKSLNPTVPIVDSKTAGLEFDFHIPILSMPLAFRTDLDTIPARNAYLRAEPDLVEKWQSKIGKSGFKIGICWQGSKGSAAQGKPFALSEFRDIAKIANVRLISLQKGEGVEQLRELPPGMTVESLGEDPDSGPDAFIDTAAVMASLDLIITTDTSIAHLAGALGRPVWVALKYVLDWRWLLDRSDSPWYSTMRLFRQTSYDNWASAFVEMEALLREQVG